MSDSPRSSRTTGRWLAFVFSVVVGSVAWAPAAHRSSAQLGILAFTLIVLIWYTCFTYESVEAARESIRTARDLAAEDLTRQQAGLANGILAELKGLEVLLRDVEANGARTVREDDLGHPVLEASLARLELFRPPTVDVLIRFVTSARRVQRLLRRAAIATSAPATTAAQEEAWVAVHTLCELVPVLVSEGGHIPEGPASAHADRASLLPPSPFGERKLAEAWGKPVAEAETGSTATGA